jgi:hypothetical protein
MAAKSDPAEIIALQLSLRAFDDRGRFLRELLAHTAAGLVVTEGEAEASEAVYRLADAVVARGLKEA